jgi:hypothetical protein
MGQHRLSQVPLCDKNECPSLDPKLGKALIYGSLSCKPFQRLLQRLHAAVEHLTAPRLLQTLHPAAALCLGQTPVAVGLEP